MTLYIFVLLQLKHFLADWTPLQSEYQLLNKGKYLHPGGIVHSVTHALLTAIALMPFVPGLALQLALFDGLVHYHIDWLKQNYVKHNNLGPSNQAFWTAMGLDQLLHQFTYIAIIAFIPLTP